MNGSFASFRRCKTRHSAIPIIIWALFWVGCESTPTVDHSSPPSDPPTYAEIAELNNHRVSQLQKTYSYGVLELRWEDGRGVHSEPQVDVEMWFELPDLSAIRVDKLGEVFFWAGSDERRFWVFNLLDKNNKTAIIRERKDARGDQGERGEEAVTFFGIHPESLLELMGLRPLPDPGQSDHVVVFDPEQDGWSIEGLGEKGNTRIVFDIDSLLPQRIELRSSDGELLIYSTLSKYASVSLPGISLLSFPRSPMWIDVVDEEGGGFAKIHLNEMTGQVADQPFDRVFDLDHLIRALAPDRVDDGSPNQNSDQDH